MEYFLIKSYHIISRLGGTMTLKQIFGKNVKYYRYKNNYTQEKFSERVNLNASYISELENGNYGPTFEKIEEIAKVLGVKPHILFQENVNTHKKLPNRVDMR